jgi:AbiV family abortive infection protein
MGFRTGLSQSRYAHPAPVVLAIVHWRHGSHWTIFVARVCICARAVRVITQRRATLFKTGSCASAVLLAAFAREELGRSRILFDLHLAVAEKGEIVTEKDVQQKCADHVVRQARGQLSTVQRADADTEVGKLMRTVLSEKPLTGAYKSGRKARRHQSEDQKTYAKGAARYSCEIVVCRSSRGTLEPAREGDHEGSLFQLLVTDA